MLKTALQTYRAHPIKCSHCGAWYLEASNHALACPYHSGTFTVACPRWCPHQGRQTKCMSHRSKRWTCCDRREQGDRGSTGCKRRSHAGPPVSPTYSKQVHEMQSAFETKNRALDEQIAAISDANRVLEANKVKKDQLQVISEHLRKEREIVGRFKEMKLVKYMSDEALIAVHEEVAKQDAERTAKQFEQRINQMLDDNPQR